MVVTRFRGRDRNRERQWDGWQTSSRRDEAICTKAEPDGWWGRTLLMTKNRGLPGFSAVKPIIESLKEEGLR